MNNKKIGKQAERRRIRNGNNTWNILFNMAAYNFIVIDIFSANQPLLYYIDLAVLLTEKLKMCIKFLKKFFALGKTIFNIV